MSTKSNYILFQKTFDTIIYYLNLLFSEIIDFRKDKCRFSLFSGGCFISCSTPLFACLFTSFFLFSEKNLKG